MVCVDECSDSSGEYQPPTPITPITPFTHAIGPLSPTSTNSDAEAEQVGTYSPPKIPPQVPARSTPRAAGEAGASPASSSHGNGEPMLCVLHSADATLCGDTANRAFSVQTLFVSLSLD
jgi:hypothetical protein